MRQRGFTLSLLLPILGAAALTVALWWVVDTWLDGRAAIAEIEAARKHCPKASKTMTECIEAEKAAHAETRGKLELAEAREQACLGAIKTQSEAVTALEKATAAAQARAAAAILAADREATAKLAERERIAVLMRSGPIECSKAVAEVRKGLRP